MKKSYYGTEHQRRLGSGIIFLSQISKIDPNHSFLCKNEQKRIESQFQRGACMPWLPECRLKAEIQKSQWENRVIMEEEKWLENSYFPMLQFEDASIRILTESVARLETIRLSKAAELERVFRRLKTGERWWVVDFFEHDSAGNERPALDWTQEAVRSFFYPPMREWSATRPSGKALLRETIHDDARRISKTQGIGDAFREISQVPSLWNKGTFTYLSDVRKSFCYEEAENYIWAIVDQWRDITLQWDSRILQCVDFHFVNMLQSRAPSFSKEDLKFIKEKFAEGHILPLLKDSELRGRVESAICCQGPILTLNTFAQDVRLLQVSVRPPLNGLLPKMETKKGDTLRSRICEIIGNEFDEISGENNLPKATNNERREFIGRCYYHVFLHTIRTKKYKSKSSITTNSITDNSITELHIRNLVEEQLQLRYNADSGLLQNLTMSEGVILTQTSADNVPETEVNVERRHGNMLFKDPVARKHLYYDQINNSRGSALLLTPSSMAMHIVRVFLFGRRVVERVTAPSSGLPPTIVQFVCTAEFPKPSEINPIGDHSFDVGHDQNFPTYPATSMIPNVKSVCEAHTQASMSLREPMAASIVSGELSPASSTHTSTTKRSALFSEFEQGSTTDPRPGKRRRSWFSQREQNTVGDSHSYYRGHAPSPSSVYSVPKGTPSISQTNNVRLPGNSDLNNNYCLKLAEYYYKEIEEWDKSNHNRRKSHSDVASNTKAISVPRHPTSKFTPNISANGATYGSETVRIRTKPLDIVVYESLFNKDIVHRIPDTKEETERFAAKQDEVDRYSRFLYKLKQGYMIANNGKQLYTAINRYGLRKVLVDSKSLAKL